MKRILNKLSASGGNVMPSGIRQQRYAKQRGQGMTEYVVLLTALFGIYALTPLADEIANLETAVNNKNRGYAYALSLSDYLDSEELSELIEYIPGASEQFDQLTSTYDTFLSFTNGEIPAGIDLGGMPDIDLEDILKALF